MLTLEALTAQNEHTYRQRFYSDDLIAKKAAADLELINYRIGRLQERNAQGKPQTGDWVLYPDGKCERIGVWLTRDDLLQTSNTTRFYLCSEGGLDLTTGGFSMPIKASDLRPTDEYRDGWAWMFIEDRPQAHSGVSFKVPIRVYRYVPA